MTRIAATWPFLEFVDAATGDGEVVARTAARSPPPTRAGGQDDGSYTNSLKLASNRLLLSQASREQECFFFELVYISTLGTGISTYNSRQGQLRITLWGEKRPLGK